MKVKNIAPGRLHFRGQIYAHGEEFSVSREDLAEIEKFVEVIDRRSLKFRSTDDVV